MKIAIPMMAVAGCIYEPVEELLDDPLPETTAPGTTAPGTTAPGTLPLPRDGMWALVHPTDAPPEGPGIVHIDADGTELDRLPLPEGVVSPHGLAYDGTSLWMTEYGHDGGLYQIDPVNGDVLAVIEGIRSQGVALDGDGFWVRDDDLIRIDSTGAETDRRPGGDATVLAVTELAFDGTDVLFLFNAGFDTVVRVAPDGAHHELPDPVTRGNEGYAMALSDGVLLVVDHAAEDQGIPYRTTVLRTVDAHTGSILSTSVLPIEGWITAIAL